MNNEDYKGYYVGIPLRNIDETTLPKKPYYNDKNLNHTYLFYGLKHSRYSYNSATNVTALRGYKVYVVETQEEFESLIYAHDLNADLRGLFNENSE